MAILPYKFPSISSAEVPRQSLWTEDLTLRSSAKLLQDYEAGGQQLNDPSAGLSGTTWKAFYSAGSVYIAPTSDLGNKVKLLDAPGVKELTVTFDYNMQPVIAYVQNGQMLVRWYNISISTYDTIAVNGKSPLLTLDDRRPQLLAASDVMLFYVRGNAIYFRALRDRFLIEYTWLTSPVEILRILSVGMSTEYRLQLVYTTVE